MKMQEETIREIKQLPPETLSRVYAFVLSMKKRVPETHKKTVSSSYLRIRAILNKCSGSLSEDIIRTREDRI